MPYITLPQQEECKSQGLLEFKEYLVTVPIELRKGFLSYAIKYLGKHTFDLNYFGLSTGTDAVRSAYVELDNDLKEYEKVKRELNGDV